MMMHGITNPKVNLLFSKKFIKVNQLTSGLVTKCFVRFVPYMGLDNKKSSCVTLYLVFINNNNKTTAKTYACSALVMKVDYTEVLLI